MTTLTETGEGIQIRRDLTSDWPFLVVEPDGTLNDEFETYEEAEERVAELVEEARQERLQALRDQIAEGLEDADELTLVWIKGILA